MAFGDQVDAFTGPDLHNAHVASILSEAIWPVFS
jgi:hypothetical protein